MELCATVLESDSGFRICVQQVLRVDKGDYVVCNRFREWIRARKLCVTGSESG